jgi:hypothetical protein
MVFVFQHVHSVARGAMREQRYDSDGGQGVEA